MRFTHGGKFSRDKLVVELDVIFLCMGQTIPSYHEMYINRKVDGKKSNFPTNI